MRCEQYAEVLTNHYFFDDLIDDQYWNDDFNAETFFKVMQKEAKKDQVDLDDLETFDYETYFWNLYKHSEKGLS